MSDPQRWRDMLVRQSRERDSVAAKDKEVPTLRLPRATRLGSLDPRQSLEANKTESLTHDISEYLVWPTNTKVKEKEFEYRRGYHTARPLRTPKMSPGEFSRSSPKKKQCKSERSTPPLQTQISQAQMSPKSKEEASDDDFEWHEPPAMIELHRMVGKVQGADELDELSLANFYKHWHRDVFGSLMPTGRKEVAELRSWVQTTVEKMKVEFREKDSDDFAASVLGVYGKAFNEIAKQVSVQCADRGRLMLDVWLSQASMFEWWVERLRRTRARALDQLEYFKKQSESVMARLLHEGDLDEYLDAKEAKIRMLEEQIVELKETLETTHEDAEEARARSKKKTQEAALLQDELNYWLPNLSEYQHIHVRKAIKRWKTEADRPHNPQGFLVADVHRLVGGLAEQNSHEALELRNLVDKTLRSKGIDAPPTAKERKLMKETQMQQQLLVSAEVEVETLTQELSETRMTCDQLAYQAEDLRRRLQQLQAANSSLLKDKSRLESEVEAFRTAHPDLYMDHLDELHTTAVNYAHMYNRSRARDDDADSQGQRGNRSNNGSELNLNIHDRSSPNPNSARRSSPKMSRSPAPDDSLDDLSVVKTCVPRQFRVLLMGPAQHLKCPQDHTGAISKRKLINMVKAIFLDKIEADIKNDSMGRPRQTLAHAAYDFHLRLFGVTALAEHQLLLLIGNSARFHAHSRLVSNFARFAGCFDPLPGKALDLYLYAYALMLNPPKPGFAVNSTGGKTWLLLSWAQELVQMLLPKSSASLMTSFSRELQASATNQKIPGETSYMVGQRKIERDVVLDLLCGVQGTALKDLGEFFDSLLSAAKEEMVKPVTGAGEITLDAYFKIVKAENPGVTLNEVSAMQREICQISGAHDDVSRPAFTSVLMQHRCGPYHSALTPQTANAVLAAVRAEKSACMFSVMEEGLKTMPEEITSLKDQITELQSEGTASPAVIKELETRLAQAKENAEELRVLLGAPAFTKDDPAGRPGSALLVPPSPSGQRGISRSGSRMGLVAGSADADTPAAMMLERNPAAAKDAEGQMTTAVFRKAETNLHTTKQIVRRLQGYKQPASTRRPKAVSPSTSFVMPSGFPGASRAASPSMRGGASSPRYGGSSSPRVPSSPRPGGSPRQGSSPNSRQASPGPSPGPSRGASPGPDDSRG